VALLTSLFIAMLFAAGVYLLMKRNLFEVVLGLTLMSHAVNVFLLTMGGWSNSGHPPLLVPKEEAGSRLIQYVDPIPQALILTAIVISFGVTAFLIVLIARAYEAEPNIALAEEARGEDEL